MRVVHADPGWLSFCRSCNRHAINHPLRKTTTPKKRSSHRTAETATATAPPECPDAVMVELGKKCLCHLCDHTFSARIHPLEDNDDLDVSSGRKEKGQKATHSTHTPHPPPLPSSKMPRLENHNPAPHFHPSTPPLFVACDPSPNRRPSHKSF
jgi:hypothetical protein